MSCCVRSVGRMYSCEIVLWSLLSICFKQNIAVIMLANTKIHWVVPFFSVTTSERSQSSRSIRYSGSGVDSVGPTVGDFLETADYSKGNNPTSPALDLHLRSERLINSLAEVAPRQIVWAVVWGTQFWYWFFEVFCWVLFRRIQRLQEWEHVSLLC